jgi:RsiW-degrading membrane proteinase PrsW (M82 family)
MFINLDLIAISLIPPVLIGLYLFWRDKYVREPFKWLLVSYVLGWLIVLPILGFHYVMQWSGGTAFLNAIVLPGSFLGSLVDAFIMAALLEEGLKFLAFRRWIWRNRFFDEYYDGILYAGLISLGFASLENILYVFEYGFNTGLTRAFTAIPAHAFFGITMGYYLSRAKFSHTNTARNLFLALFVPLILHGAYDLVLFEIARFDEQHASLIIPVAILFWILMIGMLLWSRKRIKLMLRRDSFRGQ